MSENSKNNFKMARCSLIVTCRCNLKCKLCSAYSPYYEIPPHFSYDILSESIDRYFKLVSYVDKFTFSGGEPLLHKDLTRLVRHILKYSNQFGYIEIITNGTIVPDTQLVETINQNKSKVMFLLDNYGKELSIKIEEISNLFNANNIRYVIRGNNKDDAHCGGWVDYGDFSKKLFIQKDVEELFNKCALPQKMNFCFRIIYGEMHPCGISYRCMELKIIPKNKNEYVNLFDDRVTTEYQQKKIAMIQSAKSLTACAYCNGLCEDSPRFTPAEQLN